MLVPTDWPCALPFLAYPPRERWVRDAGAYLTGRVPSRFSRTHLVRGGLMMLQPAIRCVSSQKDSLEGQSIRHPPLTRWV